MKPVSLDGARDELGPIKREGSERALRSESWNRVGGEIVVLKTTLGGEGALYRTSF
jgi:hypothetical protein